MVMLLFCKYPDINNAGYLQLKRQESIPEDGLPSRSCHYSFIQALSVRMLFITAQILLVFIYHFFDKAKHYRNHNLRKNPRARQMAAGYLFFISGSL